jgi:hypothetical protein
VLFSYSTDFFADNSATLQALMVVPQEKTPVPLEDRPEDELSSEELRQLVKRFKVHIYLRADDMNTDICRMRRLQLSR